MIRLFLFDIHPLVRHTLTLYFNVQPDMIVIGDVGSGAQGLPLIEQLQPDIVTMDCQLADMDGFSLTRAIRRHYPKTAVVFFSLYDDRAYIQQANASGAAGYVSKMTPVAKLHQTILSVWQNNQSPISHPDSVLSAFLA